MNKQKGSILLIVALIFASLAGFFLYLKYNKLAIPNPLPTSYLNKDWKIYTNSKLEIVFQYPQNWTIKDIKSPSEVIDEKIELSGPEGEINIVAWNEAYGGGCDPKDHINFQIFGKTQDICHFVNKEGLESWNMITKKLPTGYLMSIDANAHSPYQKNRDIVLKILSTFKSQQ